MTRRSGCRQVGQITILALALANPATASDDRGGLDLKTKELLYTVCDVIAGNLDGAKNHYGAAHREGVTAEELARAKAQLRARLVFESDSVTNIAHQLGYFDTIATLALFTSLPTSIAAVTAEAVAVAARTLLNDSNRTVGWFEPLR